MERSPLRIGVLGARGRLGSMIMRVLERQDGVCALAAGQDFPDLDAVINTAPLRDATWHRNALEAGCHVVDVTIDRGLVRSLLALDPAARQHGRSVIAMAGLAPGLTGLLARQSLAHFPAAGRVQVSLLQSAAGTAGKQGTRDMMDLLTQPPCNYRQRVVPVGTGISPATRKLFDMDTPEQEFLQDAARMHFVTGFQSRFLNLAVHGLALLRGPAPRAYGWLRDTIADIKAGSKEASVEAIELGALALDGEGRVLAMQSIRLASDYGATAAIACAAALHAAQGRTPAGAGHLGDFMALATLLDHPLLSPQLLDGRLRLPETDAR